MIIFRKFEGVCLIGLKVVIKIYNYVGEGGQGQEFNNLLVVTSVTGNTFVQELKTKFTQNFLKIFSTFFNLRFFKFQENLLKILINYLETELVKI